ncbi:MAG: methyltransferase domain-containing protein [Patescibacteria group bacterium]
MRPVIAEKLLGLVRRNYETIAADFAATRRKEAWPELKRLAAAVPSGARVLDVGCGSGRLLDVLAVGAADYLGADNSDALLAIARQNHPSHRFISGDLLSLSRIPDSGFHRIFCLAVLPHIPSRPLRLKALQELKGKLAPDGRIIISAWNLWSAGDQSSGGVWRIIKFWLASRCGLGPQSGLDFGDLIFPWKDAHGQAVSARYYHAFRAGELRHLAQQAGLEIVYFKRDMYNYWLILK